MTKIGEAKWEDGGYCSNCYCDIPSFIVDWNMKHCKTKFCPNCGCNMINADWPDMDDEDDEEKDDVLMSVMTCKHNFTKLTNGFFDNGSNSMTEIEWCTKCGTIRKIRQCDQTIIKQYYPKGLDHFTIRE